MIFGKCELCGKTKFRNTIRCYVCRIKFDKDGWKKWSCPDEYKK